MPERSNEDSKEGFRVPSFFTQRPSKVNRNDLRFQSVNKHGNGSLLFPLKGVPLSFDASEGQEAFLLCFVAFLCLLGDGSHALSN